MIIILSVPRREKASSSSVRNLSNRSLSIQAVWTRGEGGSSESEGDGREGKRGR
jgi:hypothetical protein